MTSVSKFIEAKKRYYIEMAETAQLTTPERVIRDVMLTLSENLKNWLAEGEHSQVKAYRLYNIIMQYAAIPKDYFDVFSDESPTKEDVITIDLNNAEKQRGVEDPDDIGIIEKCDFLISSYANMMGIEVSRIPDYLFSQAVFWGCVKPFSMLHEYVSFRKKDYIDEINKVGVSPDTLKELKAILNSGEEAYLVRDCLSDLSIELGGDRKDLDTVANIYAETQGIYAKIEDDNLDSDTWLRTEVSTKAQSLLESPENLLGDIVLFKLGYDILCDKLSEKEKEAFDLILNQPFVEPIITDMINRTTIVQQKETSEVKIFTLPDNFFNGQPTSSNKAEYLGGLRFFSGTNVAKFVEMINYIADRGFIENNYETKRLLAFRLTGRMRPEGELPKIQWFGGASKGADCLFLMKCSDSKKKYFQMRQFFDADFPAPEKTSSTVHSAGWDFMRKLNELFPDIYLLPSKLI